MKRHECLKEIAGSVGDALVWSASAEPRRSGMLTVQAMGIFDAGLSALLPPSPWEWLLGLRIGELLRSMATGRC